MQYLQTNFLRPLISVLPFASFIVSAALSLPLIAADQADNAEQLEALREQIKHVQQDQIQNQHQQNQLNKQLEQLHATVNQLGATIASFQQTSRHQQKQIAELEQQLTERQLHLGKHKKLLGHLARRAYLNGQQEYLKLMLNQQDPADIQRMLSYYGYLQHAHIAEITDLQQLIVQLQSTQTKLLTARKAAATTADDISRQRQSLNASRADLQKLLTRLVVDHQDNESQLREMRKNEARLASLLEKLQQALADIPDSTGKTFPAARGELPWPARGQLLYRFGQRRQNTSLRWQGVLIDTQSADPVRAVYDGRIAFADWLPGFGLLVIVDHGDDYMTIYGHNQALLRDNGSWVKQGEIIATAGDGGGETESGLYFEIRLAGKPTDPAKWCDVHRKP